MPRDDGGGSAADFGVVGGGVKELAEGTMSEYVAVFKDICH